MRRDGSVEAFDLDVDAAVTDVVIALDGRPVVLPGQHGADLLQAQHSREVRSHRLRQSGVGEKTDL